MNGHLRTRLARPMVLLCSALALLGGCYVQTEPASRVNAGGAWVTSEPVPPTAVDAPPAVVVAAPPEPVLVAPPAPVVVSAPTAPIVVTPAPPRYDSGEIVWVAGSHRWNGRRYESIPAHYERRTRPRASYVPGHWETRGRERIWINAH
jgi:hypothetical protein